MATTPIRYAGAIAASSRWSSPGNAKGAPDGNYASLRLSGGAQTIATSAHSLDGDLINALVDRVEVRLTKYASTSGTGNRPFVITLLSGGTPISSAKTVSINFTSSPSTQVIPLSGSDLLQTDGVYFGDNSFGVRFEGGSGDNFATLYFDAMGMQVDHHEAKTKDYYVRHAGVWKALDVHYVRNAGVWKDCQLWVKDNGIWKKVYGV